MPLSLNKQFKRAEQICARNDARFTPIRKSVLELVCAAKKPLSAYDLLDQLKVIHKNPQPPTVYRALGFLLQHKLIHKLSTINAYYSCTCPGDQHAVLFLICKDCNQATELIEPDLMLTLHQRITKSGYHEQYPLVEVMGTCPSCVKTCNLH